MARLNQKADISEIFGINVFGDENMQKYLPKEAYLELKNVIEHNLELNIELADIVAVAMKDWALDNGVTHYTHWFQPLTGSTAEKHEAFISIDKQGKTILEFTGKNLSKGEADASSFPSGGIRATFEARGYTLWDCSSPAFIKSTNGGAPILYIPTAFCSFNGEALDKKTPLLRSMEALNVSALKLLKLLGVDADRVNSNVGAEQEYFLIDINDFEKRDDLKFCGRTLIGKLPPKCQETDNQYYGNIKDRVSAFMADLNKELWALGITAKTQHNEVAPCQHELVPIFSTVNIATDQNQIIMESMKKIADKHKLACLLHEKPFNGMNGSGKHNNWSLNTNTGINLLKPGKNPIENLPFLVTIVAVISAVDHYADLIRMSAANPGNEYRLGGDEAPPAIISIFMGDDLEALFTAIENGRNFDQAKKINVKMGVNYLAQLSKDASDRNRTSPFAFTGNKFEFRMVGSSATLANPNTVLNTVVAEYFDKIAVMIEERIRSGKQSLKEAVFGVIKELYAEHKRIIFRGNNYSLDWQKEARERKLPIIENCIEAYKALTKPENIKLFTRHNVMTETELFSREEIYLENYAKTVIAEVKVMLNMINSKIIPIAKEYLIKLIDIYKKTDEMYPMLAKKEKASADELAEYIDLALMNINKLKNNLDFVVKTDNLLRQAELSRDLLSNGMKDLRELIDGIEGIIPSDLWPYPTYQQILYYR